MVLEWWAVVFLNWQAVTTSLSGQSAKERVQKWFLVKYPCSGSISLKWHYQILPPVVVGYWEKVHLLDWGRERERTGDRVDCSVSCITGTFRGLVTSEGPSKREMGLGLEFQAWPLELSPSRVICCCCFHNRCVLRLIFEHSAGVWPPPWVFGYFVDTFVFSVNGGHVPWERQELGMGGEGATCFVAHLKRATQKNPDQTIP